MSLSFIISKHGRFTQTYKETEKRMESEICHCEEWRVSLSGYSHFTCTENFIVEIKISSYKSVQGKRNNLAQWWRYIPRWINLWLNINESRCRSGSSALYTLHSIYVVGEVVYTWWAGFEGVYLWSVFEKGHSTGFTSGPAISKCWRVS